MAQNKLNIRRGDKVLVISGKDAGKQGVVLAANPDAHRIIVEGVNIVSKHKKPRSAQDKGGIVKKEGTIDVSNVMVVCPTCGKPTRVKHAVNGEDKVRVCKCGAVLDKKYEKPVAKKTTAKKLSSKMTAKKTEVSEEEKPVKTAIKDKNLKESKVTKATAANTKAEKVVAKVKRDV